MKNNRIILAGIACIALSLSATAHAASDGPAAIEEKDVVSGKVKLDPAAGYLLVSGVVRQFGMFLRVPDDESRAAWEKDRQAAFTKEHKRYESAMVTWRGDVAVAKTTKSKPPAEPVEPKIETFVHEPLELRDLAGFGPMFVYAKGETISYLERVKPGTYIWYGNVMGGNGLPAGGLCMCLGSVRFEVKPGVVTNLGNALQTLPHWGEDMDVQRLEAKQAAEKRAAAGKEPARTIELGAPAYPVPATLKDWPMAQPEFHASPKMNNYFGIIISRLSPIPGVLAYHRDMVVDERTGQELASPTLVSRQKPKL
ncbi:MAG: hypothetical protein RIS94_2489 [Pseudomonadota bacterium]